MDTTGLYLGKVFDSPFWSLWDKDRMTMELGACVIEWRDKVWSITKHEEYFAISAD